MRAKIEALLLEALDYEMGPVPESLLREVLSLVSTDYATVRDSRGVYQVRFTDKHTQVPWLVVVVRPGELYGRIDPEEGKRALSNVSGESLVEFWDCRYPHDKEYKAQYVSRYYLSTILASKGGLMLDPASPYWQLYAGSIAMLQELLK